MDEIDKINLTNQTKFRLSEFIGIENYFYQEINQQKLYSKKLNNYVTIFDYIDKILIILSVTSGGLSIISFTSIIGVPVRIASASFSIIFSVITGIIKKLLNIARNKKKKHDKILMLAKSKLNSIQSLISQALNDMDISHKECIIILNEKNKNERMKYNLRSENEHNKQKIVKLSSIKSKNKRHQKNFFVFFVYIKMLEITRKNYYKCDLQTIIFPNDSQCFWINLKDFEVETKSNW